MNKNRIRRANIIALGISLAFTGGNALADEAALQAQIIELGKKLEALQKQIADLKAAPTPVARDTTSASVQRQPGGPGSINISLFGNLDVGFGVQGNIAPAGAAASGSTTKFFSGGLAPSTFGISGSVDFGDDLSGIFKLDTEFLTSTGANVLPFSGQTAPSAYNGTNGNFILFNRAAFGGLKSRFGTLTLGRQQTVAIDALIKLEPSNFTNFFMSSFYAAFNVGNAIYGQAPVNTAPGKFTAGISGNLDSRDNAMIKYASPSLGGLQVIAGYSPGAIAGSTEAGTKAAVGATYDIGSFSVGGSYTAWNPVDVLTNQTARYRLSNLGVGYKSGPLGIRAALGHTSLPSVTLKDATNTIVTFSSATTDVRGIGATYSFTPNIDLTAAYYSKKYDIAPGNQPRVDTVGLGLTYLVYPNARFYGLYDNARSRGDNGASQTLGGHSSANALAVGFAYGFNADFSR